MKQTHIYFVRHCQSLKGWKECDRLRPLTPLGTGDSEMVTLALRNVAFDYCVCSPYIRSMDTVRGCAEAHGLELHTDERFSERRSGTGDCASNIRRRWENHFWYEDGGESLDEVQKRNIMGLNGILDAHVGETVLFGTHGTALSTILQYYEKDFGADDFYRLFHWMPYVLHAVFEARTLVSREDVLIVNRGY